MTSKRNSVINKESICYPDTEKAMKNLIKKAGLYNEADINKSNKFL